MTDIPAQLTTALAGRYALDRELGRGGMATVYLARDVKHDRQVAIKVLHPELAAVLGAERFLAEIRTTANLQHPHILPLFDSGSADGQLFYVMPFVAGETLRARLERETQLPIDDAIRIAREVADALQYAHERGVIHRDIKPENILLQSGHALVADFGIALAVQSAGGQRMTQTGLSLGTPQYMAPEQAMGDKAVDARADIYALGAVVYEMLTGEPPFTGPSAQAIVAKVITEKPSAPSSRRDTISAGVEHAVLRALAKLPADRWASSAEFSNALVSDAPTSLTRAATRSTSGPIAWSTRLRDPVVLGVCAFALATGVIGGMLTRRAPNTDDAFPVQIELRGDTTVSGTPALSLDGHMVAFVSDVRSTQQPLLYVRALDRLASRALPGTEGATSPVFSPDGKWIAYVAQRRKLMKVPLDGGAPVELTELVDNGGIDWSASEDIIIGAAYSEGRRGLSKVSAAGGMSTSLTIVDTARGDLSHQWPRVLADGKTVLFTIGRGGMERSELGAATLTDGTVVRLGVIGARALGVVDNQLVYVRADGTVMAMPFNVSTRKTSGTATPVLDSMRISDASAGDAMAFLTPSGALVYTRGARSHRLNWVTHTGVRSAALNESREFAYVRLSPDARRAAVTVVNGNRNDLWILDFASGTMTPLTSSGSVRNAMWSSNGQRVLYVASQDGQSAFWWQPADGSGPPVKAATPPHNPWWADLSPDGHTTVFNALNVAQTVGSFDVETFSLDSSHASTQVAASPTALESMGRFSPDGKSIAYHSNESGLFEVYVRPFPAAGARVQISTNGGTRGIWSGDGQHLFFREGPRVMSATLARDPVLRVVSREVLFTAPWVQDFDVTRDGRFLMIEEGTSTLHLVVSPNWRTAMRQRIAAGSTK